MGASRELEAMAERHAEALKAAGSRILKARRRISLEDAVDIMRAEYRARDIDVIEDNLRLHALMFHRGLGWPLLHPFKAHRERRLLTAKAQVAADDWDGPPGDGPTFRYRPRGHE